MNGEREILATDWRSTRKMKTFRRIQEEAIRLFLVKGYEQTTIEEIAAAAGVSHMTVFRHFPTKEALVLTDEFDFVVYDAIRQRPPEEGPLEALINTFRALLSQIEESDSELTRSRSRLLAENPSLSGGQWASYMGMQEQVTTALLERSADAGDRFRIEVIAATLLAAGMIAAHEWARNDDGPSLLEMVERALTVLREEAAAFTLAPTPAG